MAQKIVEYTISMIRLVRCILISVLCQQTLDDDGLHTVICEVEAIFERSSNYKAVWRAKWLGASHTKWSSVKGETCITTWAIWTLRQVCETLLETSSVYLVFVLEMLHQGVTAIIARKAEMESKATEFKIWRCRHHHGFVRPTWFLDSC